MNWQLFIILQTILVAFSTITLRVLAKNKVTANASFVINAGLYVALYISFLLFVPFLGHINSDVVAVYWWRFLGGGLAFALTNVFTYKTLVYFDAAIATIVGTLNALFTVIGAALILDEKLTVLQAVGSLILLSGIVYGIISTSYTKKKIKRRNLGLGVSYAFLAALSFSIAAVNEKSLLGHMSIGTYSVYGIGGQFIMSVLIALLIQPKKFSLLLKPRIMGITFLSGFLRGIGGLCFIYAEVKSNNVALVSVISNFKLIIVILLGWWLLQEREYLIRKLTSATIAISGLAVMFWY
jgi:drug/metabolite transporter (DMT)-like permease